MDLIALIKDLGFPVAVASYTLIVLNKTIKAHTAMLILIAAKLGVEVKNG